jgi:hypothetical protein
MREERRSRRLGLVLCAAAAVLVAAAGSSWLWIEGVRDRREAEASALARDGLQSARSLLVEASANVEDRARWEAAVAAARGRAEGPWRSDGGDRR